MKQKTDTQHMNGNTRNMNLHGTLKQGTWLSIILVILLATPMNIMAFENRHDHHGDIWESRNKVHREKIKENKQRRITKETGQKFVLRFTNSTFRGHGPKPTILFLKKELRRQYPGIDVSSLRLREVVLVAKTKFGHGSAELRVGPQFSGPYTVAGRPDFFQSQRKHTFDKVRFQNPYLQSWGPWQLNLQGIFSVKKVVLLVDHRPMRYNSWNEPDYPHIDRSFWRSPQHPVYFNRY